MNLNAPQHPWSRLVAGARRASDDRDTAAPYGFATRVTALAFAQQRAATSFFDRYALRAVGVSCLLAVLSVAVNYSQLSAPVRSVAATPTYEESTVDDPVSMLLTDE